MFLTTKKWVEWQWLVKAYLLFSVYPSQSFLIILVELNSSTRRFNWLAKLSFFYYDIFIYSRYFNDYIKIKLNVVKQNTNFVKLYKMDFYSAQLSKNLAEWVKELECLYNISRIAISNKNNSEIARDLILKEIPNGW